MAKQKFSDWPAQHAALTPAALLDAYSKGYRGAVDDPAANERLRQLTKDTSGYGDVSEAAHANGWADSGAGKLIPVYRIVESVFPGCWPGDRQTVGSCVAHDTIKAELTTLGCEVVAGLPDPRTGMIEGRPEVPTAGILSGVLNPVPLYRTRGYNGHGWSCSTAAHNAVKIVGAVLCKDYAGVVDLTDVTNKLESMPGSRGCPEDWLEAFGDHRFASAAECNSFEEIRDALANGYGVSSCGSEGFSSSRDENGVSKRSGSWAHAMAYTGVDDRDEIKAKYGEPLILVQNSWAEWNSGPRRILGTDLEIPVGSFWARWSDVKRRYVVALCNVKGWPPQKLPDYLGGWV